MADHIDYQQEQDRRAWWINHTGGPVAEGLTVRDYFAAKALQVLMEKFDEEPFELVDSAYDWADAMMRERAK